MKKILLFLCASALMLGSCGCQGETPQEEIPEEAPKDTETPEDPGEPEQPEEPSQPLPDKPADAGERVPLEASITGVQPMTGIVLWTTSSAKTKSYVQLEFSYMLYNKVCKEKDAYDWTVMDNLLADVASRGHQAVVRFRYVYPGQSSNAVPEYIKKMEGYEGITYNSEDGKAEYPDWRSEELQRFHMEFHRRFAERYDKDPRLAFVETGFGHWAEYHVYGGKFIAGQTFPSKEFQAEFMRGMGEWFQDTTWSISIDASDNKYGPFQKYPELKDLTFGNFDDSFMCQDWSGYNWSCWQFFGLERYKKGPAGGEFSYYSSYDQKHALDKEGMHGRKFEDLVAKVHMTFIIGNDQPGKQTEARIKEAAMSMGYSFEIKDFCVNEGVSASVLISNVGVAPIYRDAWVAVDGVRGSYNLRGLMPGESTWVTIDCPATKASKPSIECDHLVKGQKIEFEASVE